MPHEFTLVDAEASPGCDFELTSRDVPGTPAGWTVYRRTLRDGKRAGVECIEIDNGRLGFTVVPTRGMGIWRAWMEGATLGWQSPVRGPVHPQFVPVAEPSGLGWLEGFDELMCRCGLTSNGAPDFGDGGSLLYPLHGRIANLPAHHVALRINALAGTIELHGIVDEVRFHFQKLRLHTVISTPFGGHTLAWHDRVENIGGLPADIQVLYHVNIGHPQLDHGSQLIAPLSEVSASNAISAEHIDAYSSYGSPQAGAEERVYYLRLLGDAQDQTRVLLRRADGQSAVGLRFNRQELPYFTLWKNLAAMDDGYVTGLEPATNLPNTRSQEARHGRVVTLAAGHSWEASVSLDWHTHSDEITAVEDSIRRLQGSCQPTFRRLPCGEG